MLLSQYTIFPKPIILFCAIHITGNRISNKKGSILNVGVY